MNRASSATGWVRNPVMKSPELDPTQASSYELGWTFNPITGCLNGCEYCYARRLANGRLRQRYLENSNLAIPDSESFKHLYLKNENYRDPFYPRFWEERLDDPFLVDRNILIKRHTRGQRGIPRGIFVCDMGELFGDWLPREWQEEIHLTITLNPQHRFYLLTKQPQNLVKFSPFPDNCWVGVTATDNVMFHRARHRLEGIQAGLLYLSLEPLLERIKIDWTVFLGGVKWLIIGAQTKPYKPPRIEWVDEIVRAADKAGIPVFLKDNLKPLLETLDITRTSFGRLTSLTVEAIKDIQGLPRQRGWYELRQEIPE